MMLRCERSCSRGRWVMSMRMLPWDRESMRKRVRIRELLPLGRCEMGG